MTRRATAWSIFGVCLAFGAAVLLWISTSLLALERAEAESRVRHEHELAVGDALWQMDAWLAPILSQEAQRPAIDYLSFNRVTESYTNLLGKLSPGDVVVPSPLLTFRSDLFPLHFQVTRDGRVSSPQVPRGNELDVAQTRAPGLQLASQRELLERLDGKIDVPRVQAQCVALPEQQQQVEHGPTQRAQTLGFDNFAQRAQSTAAARNTVQWGVPARAEAATSTGPLVPIWLDDDAGQLLLFVRTASIDGGEEVLQGFVADWPAVRVALLDEVKEAPIEGAWLERADWDEGSHVRMLTTIPAKLTTVAPPVVRAGYSPAELLLTLAWLAFAVVATIVGFTLRQALAFGDRRARFASAVAHELRTPLTTFRMYSELLATDVIRDPAKRQEYLETLQSESDRLARLVENVLGYARVEDGRFTANREVVSVSDLVKRHRAVLERRARESDRELTMVVEDPDLRLEIDVDAVGQILFNLVDNACKYGAGVIEIRAVRAAPHVELSVRDHGSGIAGRDRARIFAAFDRSGPAETCPSTPGVGLGLALARGLARDLGGGLRLEDASPGARFVLTLPLAPGTTVSSPLR